MEPVSSPPPGPLVIVGSLSPPKLGAVAAGFELLGIAGAEVRGLRVPDAPRQPLTDALTLAGAEHRAEAAMAAEPAADYWVGIEGGLETVGTATMLSTWIVVRTANAIGRSRSASYEIPTTISRAMRVVGDELGSVTARLRSDTQPTSGLIGLLTEDRITRESLYVTPVALALVRLSPAWIQTGELLSVPHA